MKNEVLRQILKIFKVLLCIVMGLFLFLAVVIIVDGFSHKGIELGNIFIIAIILAIFLIGTRKRDNKVNFVPGIVLMFATVLMFVIAIANENGVNLLIVSPFYIIELILLCKIIKDSKWEVLPLILKIVLTKLRKIFIAVRGKI